MIRKAASDSHHPPPSLVPPPAPPLIRHNTWSPDVDRKETWLRRKVLHKERRRAGRVGRSVTDDDLDELCACIDLGFVHDRFGGGIKSDGGGGGTSRLAETFPALDLYYTMNQQRSELKAGEPSSLSDTTSSAGSSPRSIYSPARARDGIEFKPSGGSIDAGYILQMEVNDNGIGSSIDIRNHYSKKIS